MEAVQEVGGRRAAVLVRTMVEKIPRWLRDDLASDDNGRRKRAEDSLAAMILELDHEPASNRVVEIEGRTVALSAPATIGVRHKRDPEFAPQVAGLTLRDAAKEAAAMSLQADEELCLWIRADRSEFVVTGRPLEKLLEELA